MTAFTQIPSLVSFSPLTTILSADVNSNNAAIRNAFNGLVTGSNAIAVDAISENTLGAGVTVNKKWTVSAGVATFASGIAITGGVVSGTVTFQSNVTCAASLNVATGFTVSGGATFQSTVTCGASLNFAAGAAFVMGTSDNNAITFKVNNINRWSISAGGTLLPVTTAAVDIGASATAIPNNIYAGTVYANTVEASVDLKTAANTIWSFSATPNIVSNSAHFKANSFNITTATIATSTTIGYIFIPAVPGTSTGVPNLIAGGGVAIAYDTTNNRLEVYNGGWKTVALA